MKDLTIDCPKCGTEIKLTESLAAPLVAQKVEEASAKIRIKEEHRARQLIEREVGDQAGVLKELQLELVNKEKKLGEAQQEQAKVLKQQRALEEQKRESGHARLALDIIGPHESGEKELTERLGISNEVRFHGQVSYQESRKHQREADVLLLLQVHGAGYDVAVPGKLYEYLASGRPILAFLKAGEAADLVRRSGGWVVDPEDMAAAQAAFTRLLSGERPAAVSEERTKLAGMYRRDRIAEHLSDVLSALLEQTQKSSGKRS